MSTLTIDTLRLADGLKAAGAPAPQAEATARLLGEALADAIDPHDAAREKLEATIVDWRIEWRGEMSMLRGAQQHDSKRLNAVELGLGTVEQRLDKVEQRLDKVELRLDAVELRLGKVEQAVRAVELQLYGQSRDLGWLKIGHALVLASVLSLVAKAFA
jgi:chromosome segregation ATPase